MADRETADVVRELAELRQRVHNLADWHETKAAKARRFPGPGNEDVMKGKAVVHDDAAAKLKELLR